MRRILAGLAGLAVAGAVVYGSVSHAAPDVDPWSSGFKQWQHKVPQKFEKEMQASFIDAGTLTVGGVTLNVSRGTLTYDMPALPTNGTFAIANNICHDSVTTATLAACPFGSTLALGIDQVMPASSFGVCHPYLSAANTGIVRCCGAQVDAGTWNIPDASYTITCIK